MKNLTFTCDKSEKRILSFLEKMDRSFSPKLSSKVNLTAYSQKISKFANVFFASLDNTDIGIAAFYVNSDTRIAYITIIGVLPEYQRRGIGKELLDLVVDKAQENNMEYIKLEVDTVNISAIEFYRKNGFTPSISFEKNNNNSFYMLKYLNL